LPRLATFLDLHCQNHTLGLFCPDCNRWGEADLPRLIAGGDGARSLLETRFRCRTCGGLVEKQLRPPVPAIGGAEAYIRA
jgi:hypothetical protein